jgi:hypothetical protein
MIGVMPPRTQPSPALADLYRFDERLGVDPLAIERAPSEPSVFAPPLRIDPPDRHREEYERELRAPPREPTRRCTPRTRRLCRRSRGHARRERQTSTPCAPVR